MELIKRLSLYIFLGLLAYMPLHILLSTWIGSSLDILPLAKIAKDIVLVVGFMCAAVTSYKTEWIKRIRKDWLVILILGYASMTLLLALVKPTDTDAEILGVVYNTRFLLFFLYGCMLVKQYDQETLRRKVLIVIIGAGLIVAMFGIIQYVFLPNDALRAVGYQRSNGVLPVFLIDEKPDLERVMSTIRDPNSLGSYLIIIIPLLVAGITRLKTQKHRIVCSVGVLVSLLCLWFTFSRSAWLGLGITVVTFLALNESRMKQEILRRKKLVALTGLALITVFIGGLVTMKDSYFVQNVIFHADQSTVLEDPNELRIRFWKESVSKVANNPEGSGPGTAGLASIRNDVQGVELNENYYLQLASEVGVLGLLLFLAIVVLVALRLYGGRENIWAVALLSSLAGLMFTNFLVHIWANEAVAYTWWGLAGIVVATGNKYGGKNDGRKYYGSKSG